MTEPDELAGKSVALQGLPGARISALWRRRRRPCQGAKTRRASADAGAFAAPSPASPPMSTASPSRWSRDGARARPTRRPFSVPPPTIPIYHAPKEVTLDLFKTFSHRHRAGARPEARQAARSEPRRGQAEARRVLAERSHLRQRRRQSRRRAQAIFAQRRLRPSRGRRIRRASRTRSCSTSIMPSRSCAASTSRWPRWSTNEDLRAKIEALARRAEKRRRRPPAT